MCAWERTLHANTVVDVEGLIFQKHWLRRYSAGISKGIVRIRVGLSEIFYAHWEKAVPGVDYRAAVGQGVCLIN